MIKPLVDVADWCNRYGLEVEDVKCINCGKMFPLNIPMALPGYRGLMAEEHDCGQKYISFCVKPVSKEEIEFWMAVKHGGPLSGESK